MNEQEVEMWTQTTNFSKNLNNRRPLNAKRIPNSFFKWAQPIRRADLLRFATLEPVADNPMSGEFS
jgi:hypothetical protein